MSIITREKGKIMVCTEVPIALKKEVGILLNTLIQQYDIKGKFIKEFKEIFKSNLYIIIDNHYNP